jgi:NADPH-dependent curcumin reductase CurA
MAANRTLVLRSRPEGHVEAANFALVDLPIPQPGEGQLLLENLYLSIDPGVRNLMGAEEGYLPPVAIGSAMTGTVLGRVVRSCSPGFAEGDIVVGRGTLGEYGIVTPTRLCWKVDPAFVRAPEVALGVMGVPGLTAYFGMMEIGRPRPGQTVLVSSAAGGVGSLAAQIGKIAGCRVVGIAGGPAKTAMLTQDFGLDAAIDYRRKDVAALAAAIGAACPDGVDVFFDNVGGTVLDAALARMNPGGRIAACGFISQYDSATPPVMTNLFYIVARSLELRGFLLFDFEEHYGRARAELDRWLAEGRLRLRTDVLDGIDAAIPAFLGLFAGSNKGKLIVRLRGTA